jgi:hypothetical protein
MKTVHAHFKTLLLKLPHEIAVDDVTVLGDEVPRRAVSSLELDLKELRQSLVTSLTLDVMREHHGPRPFARPYADIRHGAFCHGSDKCEEKLVEVMEGRLDRPTREAGLDWTRLKERRIVIWTLLGSSGRAR